MRRFAVSLGRIRARLQPCRSNTRISGFSPCESPKFQGLKPKRYVHGTARLKSCPDTKPYLSCELLHQDTSAGISGFTLLEMMVATLIMGIAVAGLMSGIAGATRNAARLTAYDRAVQLAQSRMNALLVDESLPRDGVVSGPFDPNQSGGLDAGWAARLTAFEVPPNPVPGDLALDRIELEVWWMSGQLRRTFTLDAYRERTLKPTDLAPAAAQ